MSLGTGKYLRETEVSEETLGGYTGREVEVGSLPTIR